MKVKEFAEIPEWKLNKLYLEDHDLELIEKEVDIDSYDSLQSACKELVYAIEDDELFCGIEWNFMQNWLKEKGFTEDDWSYVEACGYEYDQFERKEEYE